MAISEKMRLFGRKSSWIRKMFEEGARMKAEFGADQVCDFSLGNPDLPPPPQFTEVIRRITVDERPGAHGYMPNGGYPWVKEALAARMSAEQGVTIAGSDMLMTCGAAGGLNVVFKALLNPGEEVILLAPYFVEYNFYLDNHGGVGRTVKHRRRLQPRPGGDRRPRSRPGPRRSSYNSPNNPTGQIYDAASLAALGELLETAGRRFGTVIYLIADEPYRKIVFDGSTVPGVMAAYRNSIVVSSYSKDLSLPGERIGYLAVHPEIDAKAELVDAMTLANRILGFVNAPALMQRVVAELQGVSVDTAIYARRRESFCSILREAGYRFSAPKGAFYIFPQSPLADDVAFIALLQEQRILAVPGVGFGAAGCFRLAFCVEDEVIRRSAEGFREAMARAKRLSV